MDTSKSVRRIAALLRRAPGAAILAALVLTLGSCPEMLQTPLLEEVERIVAEGGGSNDTTPPTIGSGLVVGTATQTSIALSWGSATDETTAQAALQYRVMRGDNEWDFASIENAITKTQVVPWTSNTTSATASGLSPGTSYWFAVLVKDAAGNQALYAAKQGMTLNANAPSPGDGPTFANIGQTSVVVNWTAATDDSTPQANLQYKLVRASAADAIDTVAEADAITGAGLVMDWRVNDLSESADGLSLYTTYHFAVLVKDDVGNKSLYAPQSVRTLGTSYTVTFDAEGGSTPANKTVYYGSRYDHTGALPSSSRTGYTFAGWWTGDNGTGTNVVGDTVVTVTSNHTLYAKWTMIQYTITFDSQGGSAVAPQVLPHGSTATQPNPAPTRAGHTFGGWYQEPGCTNAWNFSTPITTTRTLYAKWTILQYTVTFDSQGGGAVAPQVVPHGSTVIQPSPAPTRAFYTFASWYQEPSCINLWSFSTPITAARTLYAKWTEDPWTQRDVSGDDFSGITISADGTRIAACTDDRDWGMIWTSTDGGANWRSKPGSFQRWKCIVGSANGTKLVAWFSTGDFEISSDWGLHWTTGGPSGYHGWTGIAISADGTKLAACASGTNPGIYRSTDGGVNWTGGVSSNYRCIATSEDGMKLVVCSDGGYIYSSTNGGASWTECRSAGSRNWRAITSSINGTKLAACVSGGYIYTSADGGVSWNERTSAGSRSWSSIACSEDGTKIVACVLDGGYIYSSTDGGASWNQLTSPGSRWWTGIASSADGTKLAACARNGYIYMYP